MFVEVDAEVWTTVLDRPVAYDPADKVFYTSDFGPDLKPADKDGKGQISKVSADGKILEPRFLPKLRTTSKTGIEIAPAGAYGLE